MDLIIHMAFMHSQEDPVLGTSISKCLISIFILWFLWSSIMYALRWSKRFETEQKPTTQMCFMLQIKLWDCWVSCPDQLTAYRWSTFVFPQISPCLGDPFWFTATSAAFPFPAWKSFQLMKYSFHNLHPFTNNNRVHASGNIVFISLLALVLFDKWPHHPIIAQ